MITPLALSINQYFRKKLEQLIQSKTIRATVRISRSLILPGFDGMPLYDVAEFFIKGLKKGAISMRAAAFSYNFFLALFPAIIFFFTIIPYIPISGFQDSLMDLMQSFIPKKAFEAVEETLLDIVKRPRGGLLSIGFVMALYFSTNGIHSLIESFNQTHHSIETRNWLLIRLVSILLVIILSILVVMAIILITLGPIAIDFLSDENIIRDAFGYYLISVGKWMITLVMLFLAFSFLYYLAPARKSRFRFISAGSTLATLLTAATSIGFNYYVNNLSQYNTLYGSIGTLIIVMIWIYFNAMIVLIGFELNVSIQNAKKRRR
ncbi:MAG: YihY/virulence factor BrkB family protein [Bacteroidales bacterium]|nr:YihY/virulence factor BrkB family protein [Bacteroidales bacterium]MBK7172525.1 YihY/virulence factor BrkB family protein [Bacteroidales bacterium]